MQCFGGAVDRHAQRSLASSSHFFIARDVGILMRLSDSSCVPSSCLRIRESILGNTVASPVLEFVQLLRKLRRMRSEGSRSRSSERGLVALTPDQRRKQSFRQRTGTKAIRHADNNRWTALAKLWGLRISGVRPRHHKLVFTGICSL